MVAMAPPKPHYYLSIEASMKTLNVNFCFVEYTLLFYRNLFLKKNDAFIFNFSNIFTAEFLRENTSSYLLRHSEKDIIL